MLATSEVTHNSRVLREAGALARLGFQVCILGRDCTGMIPEALIPLHLILVKV